jgi:hypothetical protein
MKSELNHLRSSSTKKPNSDKLNFSAVLAENQSLGFTNELYTDPKKRNVGNIIFQSQRRPKKNSIQVEVN